MEELIQINNGAFLLDRKTAAQIADFEKQIKALKEKEDALKASLLAEMQKKNIVKLETPELDITYIASTMRESFDTKAFRAEYPSIYDEFARLSPVSASIRFKVK